MLAMLALLAERNFMATITVRDLDDDVRAALKRRAAHHNRSMEAEVRAILIKAVSEREFGAAWLEFASEFRGEDIPLPERTPARVIEFE